MANFAPPQRREAFEVAVVCALPLEYDAATLIFDEFWDEDGDRFGKAQNDPNSYTTGRMGRHNVVLALLPNMGKVGSAGAAAALRSSYTGLKIAILAGVCGGVPSHGGEVNGIVLGDVVVSKRVVQFDLGRQYPDKFTRKDTVDDNLGRASLDIRSLIGIFETEFGLGRLEDRALDVLDSIQQKAIVKRRRTRDSETQLPRLHVGNVASGDTVMKSGEHRDRLAKEHNIIAFEMEGAGMWDQILCVVVKGVCDYADSHKNKRWQPYAAITSAAATRAILDRYIQQDKPIAVDEGSPGGRHTIKFNNTGSGTQNNNTGSGKQYVAESMSF
ncbi:hypothetical protein CkaCkLH20_00587 [Colletotrichum karsti]|uniref:Nucleoside phosphorylase domain-containing protein n=1 Tax=Colletotrichum karsti TaxID=1095194 RepID=A0A9P6IG72_9PEZI|nr:uncharacterized protein CkaCkLH20_00587 [Colletotrichum karsti]KAF9881441.1 hypothetical protein CkaCkLH20_00587 [Colletotrichum karsti]